MCVHKFTPYLSPGRSRTETEISAASGHSFSTSSNGPQRDLLNPRKDFFTEKTSKKEKLTHYSKKNLEITYFIKEASHKQ